MQTGTTPAHDISSTKLIARVMSNDLNQAMPCRATRPPPVNAMELGRGLLGHQRDPTCDFFNLGSGCRRLVKSVSHASPSSGQSSRKQTTAQHSLGSASAKKSPATTGRFWPLTTKAQLIIGVIWTCSAWPRACPWGLIYSAPPLADPGEPDTPDLSRAAMIIVGSQQV